MKVTFAPAVAANRILALIKAIAAGTFVRLCINVQLEQLQKSFVTIKKKHLKVPALVVLAKMVSLAQSMATRLIKFLVYQAAIVKQAIELIATLEHFQINQVLTTKISANLAQPVITAR